MKEWRGPSLRNQEAFTGGMGAGENEAGACSAALRRGAATVGFLALTSASHALGQTVGAPEKTIAAMESSSLPDAPQPVTAGRVAGKVSEASPAGPAKVPSGRAGTRMAGEFDKFVEAGEIAPRLTVGDKILIGMRGSVSPYAVIGWISSATYSEAIDGSPYYGQNGKDYLQRLGAASAKATSEDIFTNSVMAPLLHEDPRYYQLGRGHRFLARFGYSVTRVLVTKTDAGAPTVNYAVLGGNLAGSALTQVYYPPTSRGFGEVMKTFGTSLLGQGVGDVFQEFILESAEFLQLKRRIPGI